MNRSEKIVLALVTLSVIIGWASLGLNSIIRDPVASPPASGAVADSLVREAQRVSWRLALPELGSVACTIVSLIIYPLLILGRGQTDDRYETVTGRALLIYAIGWSCVLILYATVVLVVRALLTGFLPPSVFVGVYPGGGGPTEMQMLWSISGVNTLLTSAIALAIYLILILRNQQLSGWRGVGWLLAIVTLSLIAMPVYWYKHVWREAE